MTPPPLDLWSPWADEAAWQADHAPADTPEESATRARVAEACKRLTYELVQAAATAPGVPACRFLLHMSRLVTVLPSLPASVIVRLARVADLEVQ